MPTVPTVTETFQKDQLAIVELKFEWCHLIILSFRFLFFYIPKSEMWSNIYPIVIISYKYLNDILNIKWFEK